MRVLFLCPHSKISGGVKVIYQLAGYLSELGVSVTIGVLKNFDRPNYWYKMSRAKFNVVDYADLPAFAINEFDVCVTFGDGPDIQKYSCKKILFLQGYSGTESARISQKYDHALVTSKWLMGVVTSLSGNSVSVTPPGIDPIFKRANVISGGCFPVIGTNYHPAKDKNFEEFVGIVTAYRAKTKKYVHCAIVSAYPIDKVPELDKYLVPYTIHTRPLQGMLPAIYTFCDIWLATSKNEGFGLPPLEAMACGCPVLARPNRGLDGILKHGSNCLLYDTIGEALSGLVGTFSRGKEERRGFCKAGVATVAKFTWEKSAMLFHKALLEVV